ncbi:MAG: hypothetical protein VXZ96_05030 [Myxococcota bacterium]|nr:hypothetical protein [Myxococcota bacterium]
MQIPRLHLFEIHEQPWFPSSIRDGVTDGLFTVWKLMFWKNTLPHLQDLLKHSKGNRLLDLCSGAGGPLPLAVESLRNDIPNLSVVLSDINPHCSWKSNTADTPIEYHPNPVNAMSVPTDLGDARTLFEAFHHFRPKAATAILSDAVKANKPIAVFEFQRRQLFDSLMPPMPYVLLVSSLLSWLHTPFRWSKLLATLFPIIPFVLTFDGIVSTFRTYTPKELAEMARSAGTEGYHWEVRQTKDRGFGRMTCLIGWPAEVGGVSIVEYG